jgi:hypothetical protein
LIEYRWRETAPGHFLARTKIDHHAIEVRQETTGEYCIRASQMQQSTVLRQSHTWTHARRDCTLCLNHLTPGHEPVWAVLLDEVTRQSEGIVLTLDQQQITGC